MVEEEVDVEVFGVNLDAGLASEKGKAIAKFEQEGFEFAEDGIFKVFFEVSVVEAEEIEEVGITKDEVGRHAFFRAEAGELGFRDFCRLFGNGGALVEHGVQFACECASTPPLNTAHLGVEISF